MTWLERLAEGAMSALERWVFPAHSARIQAEEQLRRERRDRRKAAARMLLILAGHSDTCAQHQIYDGGWCVCEKRFSDDA